MAGRQVTLHLDPVRSPGNLLVMIEALARNGAKPFASYGEILTCVRRDYAYTDRTEPLSLARLLGLLESVDGGLALSPTARAIDALRPATRGEVLHFLLATAWDRTPDDALALSWAYRRLCEDLWERGTSALRPAESRAFVADLLSQAREQFPDAERISLSAKSVLGMRRWLEALDPPVIDGDVFRRRDVCARELLALAVAEAARVDRTVVGTDLLLSPERRRAICRLCLLEPAALDRRLDQTVVAFPELLAPGTRAGPYGRFVRVLAPPDITRFVR